MSFNQTSGTYANNSDADVRAQWAALLALITSVGWIQTTDTGQFNTSTGVRGAGGALTGYMIFRNPDDTIRFRLEMWQSFTSLAYMPTWRINVGQGSNGSGTITGQTTGFLQCGVVASGGGTNNPTGTPQVDLACADGSDNLGVCWGIGQISTYSGQAACGFIIEKMVDATGVASGLGFVVTTRPQASATAQCTKTAVRTAATAATYASSTSFCAVPGNVTTSNVGADRQLWPHAAPSPRSVFSNFVCTNIAAELPMYTTHPATLVGAVAQTMIALGNAMGSGNSSSAATTWGLSMRWQ